MTEEKTAKRILVVDDDELLRDFYIKVLKSEGYETEFAANGDEAVDTLKKNPNFALAIIDLLMPIRTGWELIELMKSNDEYKDIPVIALTGLASSFNDFHEVEEICDAVMHKGKFELSEFINTINKTVR
ncbi:MAG: response regulator [Kiritimatiellaeota bacterium]|nr:response regulator [Kiritimatiellota bacterium]